MRRWWQILRREIKVLSSRPLMWVAMIATPLFCALMTATIFGTGRMEELPIGIIDLDASPTSRQIIRTIDSSPTLRVLSLPTSLYEAEEELRKGAIYGYVLLPEGLEGAMEEGKSATIPYYYHYALMSVGGEVATTLRSILEMVKGAPVVESGVARGVPQESIVVTLAPIGADIHPLGNPTLNYNTYLSVPFFFIMFQIIILITTLYLFGYERDSGRVGEWLQAAGGDAGRATLGKLFTLVLIFTIVGSGSLLILNHFVGFSMAIGRLWWLMVLLVVASVSLAEAIYALVPITGVAISIVSMIGSLGATLSGVTFPIASMYPAFRHISLLLPVRHFTLLMQNDMTGKGWIHTAALLAFALLPLLTMGRMRRVLNRKIV